MDVAAWCRESRVWVVAGKGGVGKTTTAAALAAAAADAGLSVLVIELEGKHGLSDAFGHPDPLGYEPVQLRPAAHEATGAGSGAGGHAGSTAHEPAGAGGSGGGLRAPMGTSGDDGAAAGVGASLPPGSVWGRRLTPDDALLEYLADHGLHRVSRRLSSSGVLDVVATAVPGIRDVLVLGKVKQLERSGLADLLVVDAPATGHAMTFLGSASGLLDAARGGPVRSQAQDVVELLQDPARCRVLLVTLPEEMPVSETIEAAYQLEDRVGVHLAPVVVNAFEDGPPALATTADKAADKAGVTLDGRARAAIEAAREFRRRRLALVEEQVGRLAQDLPLPQLRLPRLLAPAIGPVELDTLRDALIGAVEQLPSPEGTP